MPFKNKSNQRLEKMRKVDRATQSPHLAQPSPHLIRAAYCNAAGPAVYSLKPACQASSESTMSFL